MLASHSGIQQMNKLDVFLCFAGWNEEGADSKIFPSFYAEEEARYLALSLLQLLKCFA